MPSRAEALECTLYWAFLAGQGRRAPASAQPDQAVSLLSPRRPRSWLRAPTEAEKRRARLLAPGGEPVAEGPRQASRPRLLPRQASRPRRMPRRTRLVECWDAALDEDAAENGPLALKVEVVSGRKHWHCSGRGSALCKLATRRRAGATPRGCSHAGWCCSCTYCSCFACCCCGVLHPLLLLCLLLWRSSPRALVLAWRPGFTPSLHCLLPTRRCGLSCGSALGRTCRTAAAGR